MPFTFTIPNLPRETYDFVRRVAKAYNLTQRQVVIAALDLLNVAGVEDQAKVEALFERVRAGHPTRRREPQT